MGFGRGVGVYADRTELANLGSEGSYFWGGAAGTIFWIDPVEELVLVGMMPRLPRIWPRIWRE